ncbi:uncharacterized protein CEXT_558421 [Caerostris extrusa]|uniref:Uncharacterized protein n=1 Tax=Caerostris extrusa TaxID=172846 RepID=A0AAV4TTZ2_CAEEX|nr:uncharacterized protein CEXT_558421 [Caerostris extrusa]
MEFEIKLVKAAKKAAGEFASRKLDPLTAPGRPTFSAFLTSKTLGNDLGCHFDHRIFDCFRRRSIDGYFNRTAKCHSSVVVSLSFGQPDRRDFYLVTFFPPFIDSNWTFLDNNFTF